MPDSNSTNAKDLKTGKTRLSVRFADKASTLLITVGGIGTLVSVSLVMVFLVWVAFPLLMSPSVERTEEISLSPHGDVIHVEIDDQRLLTALVYEDGFHRVVRLDNGEVVTEGPLFPSRTLTAAAFGVTDNSVSFGFEDGSIQLGNLRFRSRFPDSGEVETGVLDSNSEGVVWNDGLLTRTPTGQYLHVALQVQLDEPFEQAHDSAIARIDQVVTSTGPVYSVITADGRLFLESISERENLLTGEVTVTRRETEIPLSDPPAELPDYLYLGGLANNIYIAWKDGRLDRYDLRNPGNPQFAERVDLVPEAQESLSVLSMLMGRKTLIAGDTLGRTTAWFRIKPHDASTVDGAVLVRAHVLEGEDSPVCDVGGSMRTRILSSLYENGVVRLFYVTSNDLLKRIEAPEAAGADFCGQVAIAPKDDGLVTYANGELLTWDMDVGHPEATLTSLFRPVWYENYNTPEHVWQSTGSTDEFEPKLGMMPLIFGTIKATFYTMIIAIPIAILAAIYTSEFLNPRVRSKVKPTIELMATLPSVVLGFLAALVFAPIVERWVPAVLASFLTLPVVLLVSAYLWQLLPERTALRLALWRLPLMCLLVPAGVVLALPAGEALESLFFSGDIKRWLDGQTGSPIGGWMLLLLPLCALITLVFFVRVLNPALHATRQGFSVMAFAMSDLVKFVAGLALTFALAWALASLLALFDLDPRGGILGTYVQRNAVVVGFVMGFAVIPIIYTIADDALNTVPDHLRSASLAAGATPWQTATRVVIPTAMSGLFSAVMIGLGRAVGETMIVLMATGNTPIMDWNPFSGFRTLSANIAVELPEAVRDSTHYRTLFLAALILFVMTFVLNTVAESIRLKFRKRAYQL